MVKSPPMTPMSFKDTTMWSTPGRCSHFSPFVFILTEKSEVHQNMIPKCHAKISMLVTNESLKRSNGFQMKYVHRLPLLEGKHFKSTQTSSLWQENAPLKRKAVSNAPLETVGLGTNVTSEMWNNHMHFWLYGQWYRQMPQELFPKDSLWSHLNHALPLLWAAAVYIASNTLVSSCSLCCIKYSCEQLQLTLHQILLWAAAVYLHPASVFRL